MSLNITEKQAKEVILDFYKLMDQKPKRAYLVDFFQILDEKVIWRFKDFHFDGHRGFEDHQEGKRKLFNETHHIISMVTTIEDNIAIVETRAEWSGHTREEPSTCDNFLKADQTVTWKVKLSEKTGKPIIISHICTNITLLEGNMPGYLNEK